MFLRPLLDRNPGLVEAAIRLHSEGRLPANCYVFDLDTIEANTRAFCAEAERLGLRVLAMTKQTGRNPIIMERLQHAGIESAVAVDMACARAINAAGMRLGHLGHLVQVPAAEHDEAAGLEPEHWTVFNDVKAQAAAQACRRAGREQQLLARIHSPRDQFYSGHEGGFPADEIEQLAERLDALPGARFAGITTFPALLWDHDEREVRATPNLTTLQEAAARLSGQIAVNAPGTTATHVLRILAEAGATHVEPGHGLTGTTPPHAFDSHLAEQPAALYLTEVSHHHDGRAYVFGGGMYIDPVFPDYPVKAHLATSSGHAVVDAELPPPAAIDYYGQLHTDTPAPVGAAAVFGFRFQAFVTRAFVAPVTGLASGRPEVLGIFDTQGNPTSWRATRN